MALTLLSADYVREFGLAAGSAGLAERSRPVQRLVIQDMIAPQAMPRLVQERVSNGQFESVSTRVIGLETISVDSAVRQTVDSSEH